MTVTMKEMEARLLATLNRDDAPEEVKRRAAIELIKLAASSRETRQDDGAAALRRHQHAVERNEETPRADASQTSPTGVTPPSSPAKFSRHALWRLRERQSATMGGSFYRRYTSSK
jgi:hypothetical protein